MATITNVTLQLQRSGSQAPSSNRTATVTFTTRFSLAEIQEEALFTVDVKLQAWTQNNGPEFGSSPLNIGSDSLRATSTFIEKTLTNVFTRSELDEDPDSFTFIDRYGRPHTRNLGNQVDEWRAKVILTPVTQTVSRRSPIVSGGWGLEGDN